MRQYHSMAAQSEVQHAIKPRPVVAPVLGDWTLNISAGSTVHVTPRDAKVFADAPS